MNSFNTLINVISSPTEAFRALKEKPHFLLPIILIPLSLTIYQLIYFNVVDYGWLLEQMALQAEMKGADPAAISAINGLPKMLMMVPGIIAGIIMMFIIQLIYAAYLMLVSRVRGDQLGFKAMFSLTLWCSIPFVFTFIASTINILLAKGGQLFIDAVNPFSLNNLIFDVALDSPYRGIVTQIDIFLVWSWVLLTIAYKEFTGRSYAQSTAVVLTPYILIYGIWIAIIAL